MNKKYFLITWMVLVCISHLFAGSVNISVAGARAEVRNQAGQLVYEVDPSQKFKVQVVSSGQESVSGRPNVPGIESFDTISTSQSSNMVSINGRITNTLRFDYFLKGEEDGEFVLGPVSTAHGTSSPCVIRIRQRSQEEVSRDFENAYQQGAPCQVKLSVDRTTFYVGEHIPVTAQIYCWDDGVEIEGIQSHFEGFSVQEGSSGSTEMELDGKRVRVFTKKYTLTSLWAGEKKIKPVSVQYITPAESFDDFMFSNSLFFGPTKMVNRQEAQSNGLEIQMKNLPPSSRTCDGLGDFSTLILSVDKNIVDAKSLINVSLKVVGRGNFSQVSAPRLRLPKSVRAFPGATEGEVAQIGNAEMYEKKFTYVVQPLKAGTITIPSQEFFYFNPEDEQYHTLKSRELTIVVEGDEDEITEQATMPEPQEKEPIKQPHKNEEPSQQDPLEVWENEGVQSQRPRILDWRIWTVLGVLLLIFGYSYERLVVWVDRRRKSPKRALSNALRELAVLKNKESKALFDIAVRFLNVRFFDSQDKHPSFEDIDQKLEQIGCKSERRAAFMQFLTLLAGLAYGSVKTQKTYDQLVSDLQTFLRELSQSPPA